MSAIPVPVERSVDEVGVRLAVACHASSPMDLPNPNRIDLDDRAQVLLWADMLAISADRLIEIARKVGPMSAAIRFYASKLGDDRPAVNQSRR